MGVDHFLEGFTMRSVSWLAALAVGCVLAGVGVVSANDTIRLGGPSAQAAIQGGTNTELVRWGYGYHGHYRGYYRPYYGYYRPAYYYPRAYTYYAPSYYPRYYYTPTYYYSAPSYGSYYYYPISGEALPPPATTVQGSYPAPAPQQYVPPMPPPGGTFQYDGGPRSIVPMPNSNEPPLVVIPIDGKLVSLPTQITGGTSQVGMPAAPRTGEPRATYPAYGEEPITPAPRKTQR